MICATCGAGLREGAKFCGSCGVAVAVESPTVAVPVVEVASEPDPFGEWFDSDFDEDATVARRQVGSSVTAPVAPVGSSWGPPPPVFGGFAEVSEPRAMGSGGVPRFVTMTLWGAVGGLLALPLLWGAGKIFEAVIKGGGFDDLEQTLRLAFAAAGAAMGLAVALGLAAGRLQAGGRFNVAAVVTCTGAMAAAFAAYDQVLVGSSEAELIVKAAGLGALLGATSSFSLTGALFGAGGFALAESLWPHAAAFGLGGTDEVSRALLMGPLFGLIGACIGLGASTPLGLLRWPRVRPYPRLAVAPFAVLGVVALLGAGGVTAVEVASVDEFDNFEAGSYLSSFDADSSGGNVDDSSVYDSGLDEEEDDADTSTDYSSSSGTYSSPTTSYSSSASSGLQRLTANEFSIGYPIGWKVENQDETLAGTTTVDTTIKRTLDDPHYVLRVDMTRDKSRDQIADTTRASLRTRPSYRELSYSNITFTTQGGTYNAVYLEFLLDHQDTGTTMHCDDVIFETGGRTFAILTRAPSASYGSWSDLLERARESISVR